MLYGNFDDTEGISYGLHHARKFKNSLDEIGIPYMKDDEVEQGIKGGDKMILH